jgi:hypothetical protein
MSDGGTGKKSNPKVYIQQMQALRGNGQTTLKLT